jgi:hypothetical protein
MKKPTMKEMLFNLLTQYERLQFENWALRSILISSPSEHTKKTWKTDLQKLCDDIELRRQAHEKFVPLYAQIDEANDETAVLELLAKIPLTGKVN